MRSPRCCLFSGRAEAQASKHCRLATPRRRADTRRAMSQENVEAVKLGYEVWNRGDLDAWLRLLAPDVETVFAAGPDASIYRGRDGVRQWYREGLEAWDDWGRMEPEAFTDLGDRVLVSVRWRVRGKGSGVQVEARQCHVITLRGGKAIRIEFYEDAAAALEAVGLSE